MGDLTKKQRLIYDAITAFIREKGYGPTVRELCTSVGLSSPSTVQVHLNALEAKGMIRRDPLKSRSITLVADAAGSLPLTDKSQGRTSDATPDARTSKLPLIGEVAAGTPLYAEENIEDVLTVPTDIVSDAASFILTVHGDSMIDAGIHHGDYLVIKEQHEAQNGDIVVALIEDGATVKRFYREKDHIRLQPENSTMEPIIVRDCTIVGKVVALLRRLA